MNQLQLTALQEISWININLILKMLTDLLIKFMIIMKTEHLYI